MTQRSVGFSSRVVLYAPSEISPAPFYGGLNQIADTTYQVFVPGVSGDYLWIVASVTYGQPASGRFTFVARGLETPPLTMADMLTREITFTPENPAALFELTASQPELINMRVTGEAELDTVLSLVDSAGNIMMSDDDSGAGYDPELIGYMMSQTSAVYLLVVSLEPARQGSARLTLERAWNAPLTLGDPARVRLPLKQRTVTGIFEAAEAGARYRLAVDLTPVANAAPQVTIYQGMTLLASAGGNGVAAFSLDFIAAEAGPLKIFVNDATMFGQEVQLLLTEVAG